MSYCRFEGTKMELYGCLNEVMDHINQEAADAVSEHEVKNFRGMIHDIMEFLYEAELVDEYGELNEERLDEVCELMRQSWDAEEECCY